MDSQIKSLTKLPDNLKDIKKILKELKEGKESSFVKRGEEMALNLFREMSERVPAYKKFLKKNSFKPSSVKTIEDFAKIPPISKDNYLRVYPREELCWDGNFKNKSWVISTTSGSTGEPYYFPRENLQDAQYTLTAELYLLNNFEIDKKSTLYIVAFPMGAWIGGLFTYEAIKTVSEKGDYNLSVITPGISKTEVIKAVQNLGKDFDQIIIGSYGPFLKDILDDAEDLGVNWKDYNVKFIMSAETINEEFRNYLQEKAGLQSIYLDTLNHYGTVDMGTMAHETPLAILLRRLAIENRAIFTDIFGDIEKLPTLTQFMPELFYFEEEENRLYCSAYSGLPLVRYDLKDNGGVFTLESVKVKLKRRGVDLDKLINEEGLKSYVWSLPFVHVIERNDFSVSYFAFQIYPEVIRKAFLHESVKEFITGKFSMNVDYDKEGRQFFEIHVELRPKVIADDKLHETVSSVATDHLLEHNSEFREVYNIHGAKIAPRITFWNYEHEKYFKPGGKQKWVIKE